MTEKYVYTIIDNTTGERAGAYSRAYHTEYEFSSPQDARTSNINDKFKDKRRYKLQKWKVTYELIEDDCDPFLQDVIPHYKDYLADKQFYEAINKNIYEAYGTAFRQMANEIGVKFPKMKDNNLPRKLKKGWM